MIKVIVASLIGAVVMSRPADAQLRPLEPMQSRLFTEQASIAAEIGASRLLDQRASLAGETGNLWEVGTFSAAWQTGRVILEAAGTAQRFFRETSKFETPYPDVEAADDRRRHDSGDYSLSTTVRLTPVAFPVVGTVRFGTRLPTTDNTTGLERDAIDFFATVGVISGKGPLFVTGEAGLGIHTTRETKFEQDDLMLYAVRAEYSIGGISPSIAMIGQVHGTGHAAIRGVENLGEMRAGIRAGRRYWVRAEYVKGYETFSPSEGFILTAGLLR
jgi:hypothetical protein